MSKNNTHTLIKTMKEFFGEDSKRILHALSVLKFAQQIMETETDFDHEIIEAAAILHDIGIHAAEKKYQSTAGKYQEKEGPPIAEKILTELGYKKEFVEEVCQIVGHHHSPGIIHTKNFQILYEADWLENLGDDFKNISKKKKKKIIDTNFKTPTGQKIAQKLYL